MKVQFIWCGKMGEIILQLVLQQEKKENIWVKTWTELSQKRLEKRYWVHSWREEKVDIVLLLIKPQQFSQIDFSIFWKKIIYISCMAWVSTEVIYEHTGSENIIRAMPNTPLLAGKGVVWYFCTWWVREKYKVYFKKIFKKEAELVNCNSEDMIDRITALSWSGPAYFYFITEILQRKAQDLGFSSRESKLIAENTFIWAAELLYNSDEWVTQLRKNITSPWWTTQKAIETFEKNGIKEKIYKWIEAAYARAKEL